MRVIALVALMASVSAFAPVSRMARGNALKMSAESLPGKSVLSEQFVAFFSQYVA